MKKYGLILLVLFLISGNVFSQDNYTLGQAIDFFKSSKYREGINDDMLTENDIKGSPYLNDEFIPGYIYTTSKTKYTDIPLRFNIYNSEIEFKIDGKIQALATPEVIEMVEFGEYLMVYTPYLITKKLRRGHLLLIEDGKAALYARPEIKFVEAIEPAAYKEAEPARFDKKPHSYFIRIGKEEAKVVANKKDLLNVFPDHKDEIESFIKKNKIKAGKPETLIKLVQYYNSL